jgi:hypothetical protein
MIQTIKQIFRRRTALELAVRELDDAKISKLEAETAREYASSVVAYRDSQIKRLTLYIRENGGQQQ